MLKLSVVIGLFLSFMAFAKADELTKINYLTSLCRAGQPQIIGECLSLMNASGFNNLSYHNIALVTCPGVGPDNQALVIDCFNAANLKLRLPLSSCNSKKRPQRIECIKALITQSENNRLAGPAKKAARLGRDDSGRSANPKASQGKVRSNPATSTAAQE